MMITVLDALRSLGCDVACHVDNEGNITRAVVDEHDNDGVIPTKAEIQAEITRLQDIYDSQEYARKRKVEYPDIGDQLDMLWHAMDTGVLPKVDLFYDTIKTTKDKYPKE